MRRLYLGGETQQHVMVRILRDVGNGVTFILVLLTRRVLAMLNQFLCLAGPVSPHTSKPAHEIVYFNVVPVQPGGCNHVRREKKLGRKKTLSLNTMKSIMALSTSHS